MKILTKNNSITLLLLISLLYAFIPVESGKGQFVFLLQSSFLILITLLSMYVSKFKIKMNRLGKISLFVLLFYTIFSIQISNGGREYTMLVSILFSFITASAINYNENFRKYFLTALKGLIILSIIVLILQLLIFMVTGNIIHIHEMIYPFSEARIGTDKLFEDLYRFGGFYTEPGTYSNWLYLFLVIYMILSRKIFTPLILIGSLSMILSYSVWGMVFGAYLFTIAVMTKIKKSSWAFKFLLIVSFLSFSFYSVYKFEDSSAVQFALYKLDLNSANTSTSGKIDFYKKYEANIIDLLLIGEGYKPKTYEGIGSPQDTGTIINLSVIFGILFTFIILFIFVISFQKCCGWIMLFASLPIFISKIYFSDPAFWLLYFLVVYGGYTNYKNSIKLNDKKTICY